MNASYGRDLDLNLLRVFMVVAELGSVTQAASQLYLTQPAVSAALRRLAAAVGAPLFARQGRGLVLTSRGARLLTSVRPHLGALLEAALTPAVFEPATSERTFRLGLADATEAWLLPALLHRLGVVAPLMRLVSIPVQFRNVADAIMTRRVDAAVTVADELPSIIRRKAIFVGSFVCLFDSRHVKLRKLTERAYFEREHVIVSYNGDLRGVVEDALGKTRRARCSVSSFNNLGAIIDGTPLLATVPSLVANHLRATRPHLRAMRLPFRLAGSPMELLWSAAHDDDEAGRFIRDEIANVARSASMLAA